MKRYILFALVPLLVFLVGCKDSVNPKKLVGVWEVYDASDAGYVGNKHTYFPDGRRLIKSTWESYYYIYEVDGNDLYLFKNKEVPEDQRGHPYKITLKGDTLEISDDKQTPPYWVKLRKIADIE